MSAFDGTHPKLRQSPPIFFPSMSATRPPRPAVPAAVTRPAVPAPMTTTLYFPRPFWSWCMAERDGILPSEPSPLQTNVGWETISSVILGIDEAGRGPVLGPMVVAGVVLKPQAASALTRRGVVDSKSFGAGEEARQQRAEGRPPPPPAPPRRPCG